MKSSNITVAHYNHCYSLMSCYGSLVENPEVVKSIISVFFDLTIVLNAKSCEQQFVLFIKVGTN